VDQSFFKDWSQCLVDPFGPAAEDSIRTAFEHLPNSAPGLDDIPFSLIKGSTDALLPKVLRIAQQLASGKVPKGLLDVRLVMIKKKDLAPTPADLRPISIPNSFVRIIQRWIAKALADVAQAKLYYTQSAFVPGRDIADNIQRVHRFCHTHKEGWALFVDFQKAYDSVDRESLLAILSRCGLPKVTSSLIRSLLSPYKAILAQDTNGDFPIHVSAGVPQGSPCSPLLFNIVLDPLVRFIVRTLPQALVELFADDTTILGRNDDDYRRALGILRRYFPAVGLRVNLKKTVTLLLNPDRPPPSYRGWAPQTVLEVKYLGIWISPHSTNPNLYRDAISKLEGRAITYRPKSAPFFERALIWNIYIIPLLSYIMRFTPPSTNIVNKVVKAAKGFLDPHPHQHTSPHLRSPPKSPASSAPAPPPSSATSR